MSFSETPATHAERTYSMQENAGQYDLVELRPVVVGSFLDRELAEKVLGFLNDNSSLIASGTFATALEEALNQQPELASAEPLSEAEARHTKTMSNAEPDDPAAWTETELEQAFAELEEGHKLQAVASKFGKSWTSLRGRWAGRNKTRPAPQSAVAEDQPDTKKQLVPVQSSASPLEKIHTAISEVKDQPECINCGKLFVMTPDRQDHCARCAKELGL